MNMFLCVLAAFFVVAVAVMILLPQQLSVSHVSAAYAKLS